MVQHGAYQQRPAFAGFQIHYGGDWCTRSMSPNRYQAHVCAVCLQINWFKAGSALNYMKAHPQ